MKRAKIIMRCERTLEGDKNIFFNLEKDGDINFVCSIPFYPSFGKFVMEMVDIFDFAFATGSLLKGYQHIPIEAHFVNMIDGNTSNTLQLEWFENKFQTIKERIKKCRDKVGFDFCEMFTKEINIQAYHTTFRNKDIVHWNGSRIQNANFYNCALFALSLNKIKKEEYNFEEAYYRLKKMLSGNEKWNSVI